MLQFSLMDERRISRLQQELKRKILGDVLFDDVSRLIYSTDASLYQMKPLGVVLPRSRQELVQAVRTVAKYRVPILPRGGGTSLAGQTVTAGIVIDSSKYLNRILEVNEEERWARVEPGVVLDNLNHALSPRGLFFAPDVATSSRATIGGMIGNNSAGVRSVRYGKTVDHVLALSVVLASGEELEFVERNEEEFRRLVAKRDREGDIYRRIQRIVSGNRDLIRDRYPRVMRRVGGYNLDSLLDDNHFNLAKLIVGSEGTLALVTEARINLEPVPPEKMVCVVHFSELVSAIDAVEVILKHGPTAVEIIDEYGLRLAKDNPVVAQLADQFIQGEPKAVLIVEFSNDSRSGLETAVEGMKDDSDLQRLSYSVYEGWEAAQQAVVWEVRKNALGVLLSMRGDAKPLPFIEDAGIPVRHLSAYIREVLQLCKKHGRPVAMYAHASVGVIHVRPILNLKKAEDLAIMKAISEETFQLVRRYEGSWSGEHGDGLVRSYKNREFFGDRLYRAFQEVKATFDPQGLLNPGKIVDSPPMTENLRIHPDYKTRLPETFFRFGPDDGFDAAVEMCTGVGQCRKTLTGTMCPSYMATLDEEHSTRGRANALRSAMAGDLGEEGLTSPRLYEVMDLCLECKACKSECPSSVDMARLKAEFLAHYNQQHGLPWGKRLFASIRGSAEFSSRLPRLANAISGNPVSRWLLHRIAGIESRRPLPPFAPRTLQRCWPREAPTDAERPRVALFGDTFTAHAATLDFFFINIRSALS